MKNSENATLKKGFFFALKKKLCFEFNNFFFLKKIVETPDFDEFVL